jgi:hypothetical protein
MEQNTIYNSLQISSCDTLLVGGHSFLSKAIKFFEKYPYSHGALFHRITEAETINGVIYQPGLYISEMVAKGLVLTNFQDYIDSGSDLMILKPKFPVDPVIVWNHILPQLGKEKYGFFNLLVAQPVKYLTNYRIWLGDVDDNNPPRLICGEHVEREFNNYNNLLFPNWKRDAPSDIYNSLLFTQYEYKRELIP